MQCRSQPASDEKTNRIAWHNVRVKVRHETITSKINHALFSSIFTCGITAQKLIYKTMATILCFSVYSMNWFSSVATKIHWNEQELSTLRYSVGSVSCYFRISHFSQFTFLFFFFTLFISIVLLHNYYSRFSVARMLALAVVRVTYDYYFRCCFYFLTVSLLSRSLWLSLSLSVCLLWHQNKALNHHSCLFVSNILLSEFLQCLTRRWTH